MKTCLSIWIFFFFVIVSVIFLTKDRMFHERTKHIDFWYHFVRDVARGDITVGKVSAHDNQMDMLIK